MVADIRLTIRGWPLLAPLPDNPQRRPTMRATEPARRRSDDDIALDRYRYLLQTAPPRGIERAHAEAFANLTRAQRRRVLGGLAQTAPEPEIRAASDDPDCLAR